MSDDGTHNVCCPSIAGRRFGDWADSMEQRSAVGMAWVSSLLHSGERFDMAMKLMRIPWA